MKTVLSWNVWSTYSFFCSDRYLIYMFGASPESTSVHLNKRSLYTGRSWRLGSNTHTYTVPTFFPIRKKQHFTSLSVLKHSWFKVRSDEGLMLKTSAKQLWYPTGKNIPYQPLLIKLYWVFLNLPLTPSYHSNFWSLCTRLAQTQSALTKGSKCQLCTKSHRQKTYHIICETGLKRRVTTWRRYEFWQEYMTGVQTYRIYSCTSRMHV